MEGFAAEENLWKLKVKNSKKKVASASRNLKLDCTNISYKWQKRAAESDLASDIYWLENLRRTEANKKYNDAAFLRQQQCEAEITEVPMSSKRQRQCEAEALFKAYTEANKIAIAAGEKASKYYIYQGC